MPAGSWVAAHRDALMGVTPFVALILFFTTKWWVWFLLIPAMGTILYAGGDQGRRRQRGAATADRIPYRPTPHDTGWAARSRSVTASSRRRRSCDRTENPRCAST